MSNPFADLGGEEVPSDFSDLGAEVVSAPPPQKYEEPIQYSEDTVNSFQPVDQFQSYKANGQSLLQGQPDITDPDQLRQLRQYKAAKLAQAAASGDPDAQTLQAIQNYIPNTLQAIGNPSEAPEKAFSDVMTNAPISERLFQSPIQGALPRPEGNGAIAGAVRGAENLVEGLPSVGNLTLGLALPGAPSALQKVASAYFGVTMGHDAIQKLGDAYSATNSADRAQALVEGLGGGALALGAISHIGGRPSEAVDRYPLQVDPDLGIVKTPAGPLKVTNGVAQPLTPVEAQSAAALKGPEAVAPTPGAITQGIGDSIDHPIIGSTVDFTRKLTTTSAEQAASAKITGITRGDNTRGGSQTIQVHFDDGSSVGGNAGLQSDGSVRSLDDALDSIVKLKGKLRGEAPTVTEPVTEPPGVAPALTPIHPDTFERESGETLEPNHVPYRDPTTLQVFQAPHDATPEQLQGIQEAATQENAAAEARSRMEALDQSTDQARADAATRSSFTQDENGKLVPNPTGNEPASVSTTDAPLWQNPDRLEALKSDILGQHAKAQNGMLTIAGERVDPIPNQQVQQAVAAIDERITQLRQPKTFPIPEREPSAATTEPEPPPPSPPEVPTATAPEPSGDNYGITKADTIAKRAELGLPDRVGLEDADWATAQAKAKAVDAADSTAGPRLAKEMASGSRRALNPEEKALLQNHYAKTNEAYHAANDRVNDAVASGDDAETFKALAEKQALRDQLHEAATAIERGGSISGAALNAQKMVANSEFELGHMLSEREASKGAPLTEAQKEVAETAAKKINALQDAEQIEQAKTAKQAADDATDAQIKQDKSDIAKETPAPKKSKKAAAQTPGKIRATLNDAREAALARIKARSQNLYSNPLGVIPHLTDEAIIGASHIANGLADFGSWSKEMVKDLGEKIRPFLTSLFEKSKQLVDTHGKLDDLTEKMAARAANGEGIGTLAPYVKRMGKELVRSGIGDRDDLVNALHDRVKKILPDVTRDQVRDAYSGYGDFRPLSKDEVSKKDRDLKGQLQQVAKLEGMQRGEAPLKTGQERRTPSDEERRLQQKVEQQKKIGGYTVTDPETQLRSTLQAHERQLSNQIKDVATEIDTGTRKTSGASPTSDRIEYLKTFLNRLRETRDAIFGKKELTDEQRLKMATDAMNRQADEYDRQVDKEDFLRKQGKPALTNPEFEAAKARRDAAKAQRDEYRALDADYQKQSAEDNERRATAAAKTRATNQLAVLKEKNARGDFETPPKRVVRPPSPELQKIRTELADEKNKWRQGNLTLEASRRPNYQKALDFTARLARFSFLSTPSIIGKLALAAAYRPVLGAAEETAGMFWKRVLPEIAKRAPYEGGPIRPIPEARAMAKGVVDGIRDAWNILKTGHSTISKLYGDARPELPQNRAFELVQAFHDVVKNPLKNAILERSMIRRSESLAARGVDVHDPAIIDRNLSLAYQDAERGVMQQKNSAAQWVNSGIKRGELINKNTGRPDLGKALLGAGAKFIAPIVKIPLNFFWESAPELMVGVPAGLKRARDAYKAGVENLTDEEGDNILRLLKKGSVGPALLLFGYLARHQIGGFFVSGQKNPPGQPEPGKMVVGGKTIPEQALDSPMFNVMNAGATFGRTLDTVVKGQHKTIPDALGASFLGLVNNLPGVHETTNFLDINRPGGSSKFVGNLLADRLVPGAVRYAAKLQDTPEVTPSALLHPEPTKRTPTSFPDYFKQDIPYLREQVGQKPGPKGKSTNYGGSTYKTGYTSKKY